MGSIKIKKMKHLIQAMLRWREQRLEWRRSTGAKPTPVDDVIEPWLELVTSETHNDLVLCCGASGCERSCGSSPPALQPSVCRTSVSMPSSPVLSAAKAPVL